jgi:hypothetical protein
MSVHFSPHRDPSGLDLCGLCSCASLWAHRPSVLLRWEGLVSLVSSILTGSYILPSSSSTEFPSRQGRGLMETASTFRIECSNISHSPYNVQLFPSPQEEAKSGNLGLPKPYTPCFRFPQRRAEVGPFLCSYHLTHFAKTWSLEKQEPTFTFCFTSSRHMLGASMYSGWTSEWTKQVLSCFKQNYS